MESDYPDLYSQYSKIHSNNVEMDTNDDNMHFGSSDMKPVEEQNNSQLHGRDENFDQIEMKNDISRVKNADINEDFAHCYDNDVSNSLSDTHRPQAVQEESKIEECKTIADEVSLEQINDNSGHVEETKQSDDLPAQSPKPSVEENSGNEVKKELETPESQPSEKEKEDASENKDMDVCRVCMNTGVLITIFNTDSMITLSEKVMSCAAVQISLNDGLPGVICEPCYSDLEIAYKFKKRCEESDVALRAKLGLKAKTIVKTEFVLIDCDNEPILSDDNKRFKNYVDDSFSEKESDDPSYGSKKKKKKTKKKAKPKKPPPRAKKAKVEKPKPKKEEKKPEKPLPLKRRATSAPAADSDDDVIIVSKRQPPPKVKKPDAPVGRFPCTYCEKSFPYPSVLKLHLITHTKEKTHKCSICTKAFMYSKELYSHYKEAHPNEYGKVDENGKYTCTTCNKSFALAKHLKVHESIHAAKDKKYKCDDCPQTFTNMTSMNLHVKTDHPDNLTPYKCKICDKRFKHQLAMEKHVENHKNSNSRPVQEKIEDKRPTSTKDLFKSIAPLTTTYWSDSFSD